MNEPENTFQPGGSEAQQLRAEIASLRSLLSAALIILFVFSACVNFYLRKQTSILMVPMNEAQAMVNRYENGGSAQILDFWNKMNEYARTHPDFVPIINKYSQYITVHPNPPAGAPTAAAAPKKK